MLGVLLCVFGYMLRDMEFLPCFALMAMLCLRPAWEILTEKGRPFARRMIGLARLALPFAAVLAIAAGLHVVNEAAWSRAPWSGGAPARGPRPRGCAARAHARATYIAYGCTDTPSYTSEDVR